MNPCLLCQIIFPNVTECHQDCKDADALLAKMHEEYTEKKEPICLKQKVEKIKARVLEPPKLIRQNGYRKS